MEEIKVQHNNIFVTKYGVVCPQSVMQIKWPEHNVLINNHRMRRRIMKIRAKKNDT
jgi:hypothetical protein